MTSLTRKIRSRRRLRDFDRALRNASPSMRQELYAAAARQDYRIL